MRFISAIVAFVIAALSIGYGIAQRTVLAEPDHVAAVTSSATSSAVTIIDGDVLNSNPGRQKIQIQGKGKIFAAYGRTGDVIAWVGEATYNKLKFDRKKSQLRNDVIVGSELSVPDPHGSDLWLGEYSRDDSLTFIVNVPVGISIIIVSDGTRPAPGAISITWPVDNRTPWSGPLIVGGMLLLLAGLGVYLWALSDLRRGRGPRRRAPKMPKPPKQKAPKGRKVKIITGNRGRRAIGAPLSAISMILVIPLLLTGCTAESWPAFLGGSPESTETPTPVPTAADLLTDKPPAVTISQAESIVSKVSLVATQADASRDLNLLKSRFDGPALLLRETNYKIRGADSSYAQPIAIPSGPVQITLPQQNESWPRTVFTVVQDPKDPTIPPTAMMLVQQSPRDNYKVVYLFRLEAKEGGLPALAAADVGAPRLQPDAKLFALRPDQLAKDYGDILLKGAESEFFDYFDLTEDSLNKSVGYDAKQNRKKSIPDIAQISFGAAPGDADVISFATSNNGAIVATYLVESETVTPVEVGAVINPEGAIKSLLGIGSSSKGTVATYGDLLLFYLPPSTSSEKIRLIGWSSGLISAQEQ
ncbi:MAG: hypothetical protein IT192_00270 [Microbacteriaceae bacterium]|nr:hypothetical protein [Microbacteriaceae bacterium]